MGNGPELSEDGWKYRGRGFIQLTGKDNYELCGKELGLDLLKDPTILERTKGAAASALWFWHRNNINRFADLDDIRGMTKVINGGYNGLDERRKYYEKAKQILSS